MPFKVIEDAVYAGYWKETVISYLTDHACNITNILWKCAHCADTGRSVLEFKNTLWLDLRVVQ